MMEKGAMALGNRLALLLWHLRVISASRTLVIRVYRLYYARLKKIFVTLNGFCYLVIFFCRVILSRMM